MGILDALDEATARQRLAEELRWISKRRLPRVFLDPIRDNGRFPLSREIAERLEREKWEQHPPGALSAVIRNAIGRLPASKNPAHCDISWRRMAQILFGFVESPRRFDETPANYNDLVALARQESRYIGDDFPRRTGELRDELASVLLRLYLNYAPSPTSVAHELQPEPVVVDRAGYIQRIRTLLREGHKIICLYGEPGTGKSVLAEQAVQRLTNGERLKLRAANKDLLDEDIISALVAEGQDPAAWSMPYCRVALRNTLVDSPRHAAVIVDDVSSEDELWQLVPVTPKVPVIVTSRNLIHSDRLASIELADFTEAEAGELVERALGAYDETELQFLVQALGFRPLALGHAVRYLQEADDVTLRDLNNVLAAGISAGLDLLVLPTEESRNLATLYREMLALVIVNDSARTVLDSFLAITGKSGTSPRELLWTFMASGKEGHIDRARFRAGLRVLSAFGLVRETKQATQDASWPWLEMHQLTFNILRELRGSAVFEVEGEYLTFLLEDGTSADDTSDRWVRVYRGAFQIASNLVPGWTHALCIDELTWVAIREPDNVNDNPYVARYEVFPRGVCKVDYRTGVRSFVELEEGGELYRVVKLYNETIRNRLPV